MVVEVRRLTSIADERRIEANKHLKPETKSALGQFMTPSDIARFMASLFCFHNHSAIRLLDAGAGVGSLTAAAVEEMCRTADVEHVSVRAFETDPTLFPFLRETIEDCRELCQVSGIPFQSVVATEDFIEAGVGQLFMSVEPALKFTHAILNPPYKKIHSNSEHRRLLRSIGVETVNLYAGFLAIAVQLLERGGELVAIVPRSFCNGPYFKPFRDLLLSQLALQRIHIFESRVNAFKGDEVLQVNIIFYGVKHGKQDQVVISSSYDTDFDHATLRTVAFDEIVSPFDPERFIRIPVTQESSDLVARMNALPATLEDLDIEVSTGPIVDFRVRNYLRAQPEPGTVPLIYPVHFKDNFIMWPTVSGKKPNAIVDDEGLQKWLYPNGDYVIVRRFSSKEEKRRIVAAFFDPALVPYERIGFENHVNVFHHQKQGLDPDLARGLTLYLNSELFDVCFRQFNGHTQVNVKDLYNVRYPAAATLRALGKRIKEQGFPSQSVIDVWLDEALS